MMASLVITWHVQRSRLLTIHELRLDIEQPPANGTE